MLKKTISYKDLDGKPREDVFWFHMSKAKLAEMALIEGDDYEDRLNEMIAKKDAKQVIEIFKDLIRDSYGERDKDGVHFLQSKELSDRFMQTDAYSELFVQLVTDAGAGAEFFQGVMPKEIAEKLRTGNKTVTDVDLPEPKVEDAKPDYDKLLEDLTWEPSDADLRNMSREQMQKAFARKL